MLKIFQNILYIFKMIVILFIKATKPGFFFFFFFLCSTNMQGKYFACPHLTRDRCQVLLPSTIQNLDLKMFWQSGQD